MDIKDNYIKGLETVVERQRLHIMQLESTILKLEERITDLERSLKLNSHTSNKPPSSDGLRKQPIPVSLRSKGVLPSGSQIGHKGSTLEQESIPTEIICHPVTTCRDCGLSLTDAAIEKTTKRQVFDVPAQRKGAYNRISKIYDRIIKDGLAFHDRRPPLEGRKKRTGHNLLLRL